MYRKGAQDAKRGKMFTKLIREITVSARSGLPDPDANPRLRAAIAAARAANMPRDTIDRAVRRGSGEEAADTFEEVRYEGYGPGGVAVIVEALTDNRNRTASEVRAAFGKHGGTLGESGSVSYMFERIGLIRYPAHVASAEDMFEAALDAGAADVESGEGGHEITCPPADLSHVRDRLEARFGVAEEARLDWRPTVTVTIDEDDAGTLFRLLGALDDNEDVQRAIANFEVADDVMDRLSA